MRLLGIDFGAKNIGLAVGNLDTGVFQPLKPIPASGTLAKDAAVIEEVAAKQEADLIVIGIPFGTEYAKQERICRRFGQALADRGLKVAHQNEAYSSMEAEERLQRPERIPSLGEPTVDSMAAVLILERYARSAS